MRGGKGIGRECWGGQAEERTPPSLLPALLLSSSVLGNNREGWHKGSGGTRVTEGRTCPTPNPINNNGKCKACVGQDRHTGMVGGREGTQDMFLPAKIWEGRKRSLPKEFIYMDTSRGREWGSEDRHHLA